MICDWSTECFFFPDGLNDLFGRKLILLSDHKPLKHLFKEDSAIPAMAFASFQHWTLLLSGYDYTIEYKPVANNSNADFLSRFPVSDAPKSVPAPPEMVAVLQTLEYSPVRAWDVKKWTAKDPLLSRVMDLVLHGGLGSQAHSVPPYGLYEHELSVHDGCLLSGNRVVIPPAGQAAILELLHVGHSEATSTKD